jgi:hypothetical protein
MRTSDMSDTEDYPGPSRGHAEKQGQHPRGRAKEEMVKLPGKPLPESAEEKGRRRQPKSRYSAG